MPAYSEEEIRAKIAEGSISAISLDTQVFEKYGSNLHFTALRKLSQFQGGTIRVVFSEIVANEVKAHVAQRASTTQQALKSAIAKHGKIWNLPSADRDAPLGFRLDEEPANLAEKQWADYLHAVNGEVVPALGQNDKTEEVIRRYFAIEIPFEASKNKKSEFPDAFALLSLEAHAAREGIQILCVSGDNGWLGFCEQSPQLVCVTDLAQALSYFNESGRVDAEKLIEMLRVGTVAALTEPVESAVEYRLDDGDFVIDAWSPVEFEAEPLSAVAQLINWESASMPIVIAVEEESLTVTTEIDAIVGFEASFDFSIRDSVDRDYVSLGSEDFYAEETVKFEVVLSVKRPLQPDLEIIDAEVSKRIIDVNFGSVDPFRNENPNHEKY